MLCRMQARFILLSTVKIHFIGEVSADSDKVLETFCDGCLTGH